MNLIFQPSELPLNPDGSVYHLHLLPHHIAPVVLTVGDPDRVEQVSRHFDRVEHRLHKREFVTHSGTYKGHPLMVVSSGIGPDNVEILMNELDAVVNIDLSTRQQKAEKVSLQFIRIGTSGSFHPDMRVGSFVASEWGIGMDNTLHFYQIPQTDFEISFQKSVKEQAGLSFEPYCFQSDAGLLGQIGAGMHRGATITAPGFYAPQGRKIRFTPRYPQLLDRLQQVNFEGISLTNFEMETATYYGFGRLFGHRMLSTNVILANRTRGEFATDPNKLVDGLIEEVLGRLFL